MSYVLARKLELGTVKNWFPAEGYGFIIPDYGGVEIFFHIEDGRNPKVDYESGMFGWDKSQISMRTPKLGDHIAFRRFITPKGVRAYEWAFLEDHEKAHDLLFDLLAKPFTGSS